MTVEEFVPDCADKVEQVYDKVRRLDASFTLDIELLVNGELHPLRSAWHVDTHLFAGEAGDGVHPRFHFQFGGKDFAHLDEAIRGVLLSEAPRLACAPLDGVLAIDFVLSHYAGRCGTTLVLAGRNTGGSARRRWLGTGSHTTVCSRTRAHSQPESPSAPRGRVTAQSRDQLNESEREQLA